MPLFENINSFFRIWVELTCNDMYGGGESFIFFVTSLAHSKCSSYAFNWFKQRKITSLNYSSYLLGEELIWRFHRLPLQAQWGLAPSYTADLKAPCELACSLRFSFWILQMFLYSRLKMTKLLLLRARNLETTCLRILSRKKYVFVLQCCTTAYNQSTKVKITSTLPCN